MAVSEVRVSQVLGRMTGAALGLSLATAFSIFVASPLILSTLQEDAPGVYVAAALLLLPIVLALAEMADRMRAGASFYQLARVGGYHRVAFGVGWLSIGGYLAVAALLVKELVQQFTLVLEGVFSLQISPTGLVIFILTVAGAHELLGGARGAWKSRTLLVWGSVLAMAGLLLTALRTTSAESQVDFEQADIEPWLAAVALLATGLWALDLILDHRSQLWQPRRTIPQILIGTWLIGNLLGGFCAYVIGKRPELVASSLGEDLSFREDRLTLMVVLIAVILCGGGLLRLLAVAQRRVRDLQIDGFFPARTEVARTDRGVHVLSLLTSAILVACASLWLPMESLVAFASFMALGAVTLLLLPFARRRAEAMPGGLRLPLHPIVPGFGAAIAIYLGARLLVLTGAWGLGWVSMGLLLLVTWGRKGGIAARERDLVLRGDGEEADKKARPVLVAIGGGSQSIPLIRAGAALARARGRELHVLKIVPFREHSPLQELQEEAELELGEVREIVRRSDLEEQPVRSLVRIAPSPAAGILSAANEQMVDLILLGWSGARDGKSSGSEEIVEAVFPATSRALGTLHIRGDLRPERVLVATAGGPHAAAALEVGFALAGSHAQLELITVETPRGEMPPDQALRETIEKAEIEAEIGTRALKGKSVAKVLLAEAKDRDLLVLGASTDRLLNLNRLEGLAAEIAEERDGPTLVVKRREPATLFWRRRLWEPLDRLLPTLSVRQRAAVLSTMRHSAKADVDFNVLISLASFIASAGLLLNSGAVIIGAMLVAPLMNPILALAQGIVQGNLRMIKRASTSVGQGTAMAIAIGTVFGLLFPAEKLTTEMLGRGQPNLLDLMVALAAGAAAAYAVSRSSVAAALPGVAISVALVPPLCVVGLGLGMAHFGLAIGAMLLYMTNLIGIVLVGAAVFLMLGFRPTRAERGIRVFRGLRWVLLAILLAAIPLAFQTKTSLRATRLQFRLESILDRIDNPALHPVSVQIGEDERGPVANIVLVTFEPIVNPQERVMKLRQQLERGVGFPITVRVSLIQGQLVESFGSIEVDSEP